MKPNIKKIAILTGGGDCPGLNAVIRAVAKTAMNDYGWEVWGIEDGFLGLIERRAHRLTNAHVSGILPLGGTILGSSNKDNPFQHPRLVDGKMVKVDVSKECIAYISEMQWDAIITIGGDGTQAMAKGLMDLGVPVVGVPKTIDNDLAATDYTFGFNTAVSIIMLALDMLHTTAMSHHRVQVVETMGRYAGWLALESGIAGGGDVILLPEIPYSMDVVAGVCGERSKRGKRFSIIVVAEGAKPIGGGMTVAKTVSNSPDPIRLGGIAHRVAGEIEAATGLETRATVLGHLQRGGSPTAFDRLLATQFGHRAARLIAAGSFGRMAALHGTKVGDVALNDAVAHLKTVSPDHPLIDAARSVGTSFGEQ